MIHQMKRTIVEVLNLVIAISVCFILLSGAAAGSDAGIEGNWMGKLGELRVVFRIAVNEDGTYTAFTDSPDQDAFDIPVDKVVFDDGDVRLEVNSLSVVMKGS